MTLPVDGVSYYLVHVESGMYVHPHGGSDVPDDNTRLVLSPVGPKLSIQWIFENNQLKHVGSGKFVHPAGGFADKDATHLIVHSGHDPKRTGLCMVEQEGRTFLFHKQSGRYVHPQGGATKPASETPLVYYSGHRPELAFTIEPAENAKVLKIDCDTSGLQSSPAETIRAETTCRNDSSAAMNTKVQIEYSRQIKNSVSIKLNEKQSFGTKVTAETNVGLPGTGGSTVGVEVSFSMEFGRESAEATETTTTVKSSLEMSLRLDPKQAVICHSP